MDDALDGTIQKDNGLAITSTEYNAFEDAFDFFNAELFGGNLPACLITLQRKSRTYGYYSAERFKSRTTEDRTDEIALNPALFEGQTDEEILSTLVHEMVHQYQFLFGDPGRGRYHNKEWAELMIERGLIPSNTGEPGGKQTGDRVSHYIEKGGRYSRAYQNLLDTGFRLNWQSREVPGGSGKKSKVKYTCYGCKANAWGKPGSIIACGVCILPMMPEPTEGSGKEEMQKEFDEAFSGLIDRIVDKIKQAEDQYNAQKELEAAAEAI